jgi:hypothetical protein
LLLSLLGEFHFSRVQLFPQFIHINASRLRLCEDAFSGLFLLGDVVLYVLRKDLHLCIVERIIWRPAHHLPDEDFGSVVFDLCLIQHAVLHFGCPARRIKNLFFDRGMDNQLRAHLLSELALLFCGTRTLELLK